MNLVRPVAACAIGLLFWTAAGCRQTLNSNGLVDLPRLRDFAETAGYTNGLPIAIRFTPDGDKVLFLRSGPRDRIRNLYEMDAATGTIRVLLRAEDILRGAAEQISPEEKARRERMREGGHGISAYQLSEDGRHILITLSGRIYVIARADGKITVLPNGDKGTAIGPRFSPNGTYVACVRDHDVYVIDWKADRQWPVTSGGSADVSHGEANG
ncbi:MAG: DPP IV N-terminal domain-containing protein [Dehalococcoidia bacterium]